MKELIYILILFIALGCSTKKNVENKKEKRDVLEAVDLSSIEKSTLLFKEWLDNSILNIEFIPQSDNASFRSDGSGVEASNMKINFNLHKDVSSTTTIRDTTKTETRTESKEETLLVKTKDREVERRLPTWIYILVILTVMLVLIVYAVRNHVTD